MSGRDEKERTFAALPPARGRGFALTWWGRAWLKALEDTALDGEQLKKGRRQAREGAVGAVSVRPGRITAVVRDRDGTAQRSDVLLQELSEEEWDRFLDMAVDRAGHIAALLDREMPPHLVEDAAAAGVELLPGIGDLEPECNCEAWDHCPHTAALCYQVARLLDQDPFVLLLMRGRGERRLLDELQIRSVARATAGAPEAEEAQETQETHGVRADEVFAARDILPPLPAPPPLPGEPGAPPALDTETAPAPGIDSAALEFLAADAAARAYRALADALSPGHEQQPLEPELTLDQDAVRLAAAAGPAIAGRLATGTGRQRAELDLAVRAWHYGDAAALSVLEEEWTPEPEALARARTLLAEAWEEADRPQLRAGGSGRWTVVGAEAQLRVGRDGRWWPYRKERGRWAPAGPADHDPAAALAGALGETG
ncbi:SWF or SNF family helicase [Streptomyces lunaelactis]|uniref:SWIM zinc finger family protein n=2 Tax=Streptomyces lunaelactis TaxID=1535768 RepID=UPI0015850A44|nr:SWF or SNF family helicase [Streptomyces lunaelactis]NUK03413.1 SWF or SNF family helicase [Streptomyces lunaelactis]NUK18344.1 SWF or SNF family helicase [Streptomyces lunaelactis]NUK24926.1 SWF or SNF family helicase [Streptomyces lunaelactis]NUK52766.1 SWF or SNF family helicase [Streptomyces lunaelactis]NUK60021.1 SWF or SNF family helicase [Streptomyces lunaelactis]